VCRTWITATPNGAAAWQRSTLGEASQPLVEQSDHVEVVDGRYRTLVLR